MRTRGIRAKPCPPSPPCDDRQCQGADDGQRGEPGCQGPRIIHVATSRQSTRCRCSEGLMPWSPSPCAAIGISRSRLPLAAIHDRWQEQRRCHDASGRGGGWPALRGEQPGPQNQRVRVGEDGQAYEATGSHWTSVLNGEQSREDEDGEEEVRLSEKQARARRISPSGR